MLASLWRLLSGEQLKVGDSKLVKLFNMVEVMIKDFGNPLTIVSMNYIWLFKALNNLGIIQTLPFTLDVLKFAGTVFTEHKERQIDGNILVLI